ncbi:MAG TPA: hypothetical protein H9902_06500 [Candidatus Stackebrandtia faecavium]|nr:hypothetical protein [Candidatus Stackebrandtia faecavium]
MLTDFVRDHAFTIAWFGLMALVWFGWAQEDPPDKWRPWLGAGSGAAVLIAGPFGYAVALRWNDGSALDGQEPLFGLIVLAEFVLAGLGCLVLWRRRQTRWMAWWVALIVGLHFVPLAFLLDDLSLIGLSTVQTVGLCVVARRLRGSAGTTSHIVGALMGVTLLVFALFSIVVFTVTVGAPW